ncbi:nitroreductase family protein [Candidatus Woesearchaeota archaeon]|nr:nitroreductase family protein [Candidatus Woesearchaeota archaeon]
MDVKKAIEERRSIRKYEDKEVSDDLIKELIDAARLAPSGNNTQPSKYFIVKDEETKAKLRENEVFMQDFVYNAPAIIFCCTNPEAYKKRVEGWDFPNDIRAVRDLSIASSYLVLRATELGLGTCYVGWLKDEKIKEILNIPKENIIPYVITIGYPAEKPNPTPRNSIDEVIF